MIKATPASEAGLERGRCKPIETVELKCGRPGAIKGCPAAFAVAYSPFTDILSYMDNHHETLNTVFHALADSTRRAVIQQLTGGPASVTELAEPFDMALPSFMKHIGVLENAGLIHSTKVGRVRTCEIKPKQLTAAEDWISAQTALWEGRIDRMASYVEALANDRKDR